MTVEEVFNKITSAPKWYGGYCSKEYASILKSRFKEDKLSTDKLTEMFNFFGFELNSVWSEKKYKKTS